LRQDSCHRMAKRVQTCVECQHRFPDRRLPPQFWSS
jgi:hypothetical protein